MTTFLLFLPVLVFMVLSEVVGFLGSKTNSEEATK